MTKTVYIGSGAGFAGDRFDAALPVIETLGRKQGPRYLIFEVMAERTLAIAQRLRRRDPSHGFSPFLQNYLWDALKPCRENGVRIVSNLGVANPASAAADVHRMAREQGIEGLRIAVVEGDDLLESMPTREIARFPLIEDLPLGEGEMLGANVYLGAQPVADALNLGVDVVLVGRTTDAALVLGPLIHEFGWREDDWDRLAAGTLAGHLLECGGQVSGGYFCDPGFKDVPDLDRLGFPIGEVDDAGAIAIGKADGTGGLVSKATVTEQILYEMHDPAAYLTPDVTLDVRQVSLADLGPDRIAVTGATGRPPPETYKATVSYDGGWLGEAEIVYAGPNAYARAKLAADIVAARLRRGGVGEALRIDVMGALSVFDDDRGSRRSAREDAGNMPLNGEYRVRAAVRTADKAVAQRIGDEVLSLLCSGPAAGGGFRGNVTEQVRTASVLVPKSALEDRVRVREVLP